MPPTVLAVAQAFKETLGAAAVASAYRMAIQAAGCEPLVVLGSDGGDGLLEALSGQLARTTRHRARDPLGASREAPIGWLDSRTAVVESRLVCGLALVPPDRRDPLTASTRGVGILVQEAAAAGAERVFVGLGGSATMDGGAGMARAWGWVPRDQAGQALPEGGGALVDLASLEAGRPPAVRVIGLADVDCPLLGPEGAGQFAAQKGADPEGAAQLGHGLERLVAAVGRAGAEELAGRAGAGAAGGLGFGILYFAGGELLSGADWVLDRIGIDSGLEQASLVLIGEGQFDGTSLAGKLSGTVLQRARAAGVPVALVAPKASQVPHGVHLESGPGIWTERDLARRAERAVRAALRLPPP